MAQSTPHAKSCATSLPRSAAEAGIGTLFLNGQEALPIRVTLNELGHTQPATPMETDNSAAAGFANDTIKQKRSKNIDMRFY
jgi:hypothetical protein